MVLVAGNRYALRKTIDALTHNALYHRPDLTYPLDLNVSPMTDDQATSTQQLDTMNSPEALVLTVPEASLICNTADCVDLNQLSMFHPGLGQVAKAATRAILQVLSLPQARAMESYPPPSAKSLQGLVDRVVDAAARISLQLLRLKTRKTLKAQVFTLID